MSNKASKPATGKVMQTLPIFIRSMIAWWNSISDNGERLTRQNIFFKLWIQIIQYRQNKNLKE